MDEKRYVIPEGMRKAMVDGIYTVLDKARDRSHQYTQDDVNDAALQGIARWLSENPTYKPVN